MASIKKFNVEDLHNKIKDPEIIALLPSILRPQRVSFELHNVNVGMANGIRRCILSEIPVKCLNCDFGDISTNDSYILKDFIQMRIRNIPVLQTIPENITFSLDVINNTEKIMSVKSSQLDPKNKKYFNETFTLTELEPNKFIKIKNIHIDSATEAIYGGYTLGISVVCLPLDQEPYDPYNKTGIVSSMSDPRKHIIKFITNGTMDPKKIISECCKVLKERLNLIIAELVNMTVVENTYQLTMRGENDTIGNMLMKTICEMFPDIPACTYRVDYIAKTMTLRIRSEMDAGTIISSAAKKCIETLDNLQAI